VLVVGDMGDVLAKVVGGIGAGDATNQDCAKANYRDGLPNKYSHVVFAS